jgi:hypothetical protein
MVGIQPDSAELYKLNSPFAPKIMGRDLSAMGLLTTFGIVVMSQAVSWALPRWSRGSCLVAA